MLIASRAIQGVGAALLMPATLAIIVATFSDVRERTMAIGVWAAAGRWPWPPGRCSAA